MKTPPLLETDPDLPLLCKYSFDTLISTLDKKKSLNPLFPEKYKNEKFPWFVTWTTGTQQNLRGCIGTFQSQSLEKNLSKFTLIAALEDDRFPPISTKEIPSLNCSISLWTNFTKAKDPFDWEVGKNGVEIEFTSNGKYSATFLPEVMTEEGWDKEETLINLLEKSGFDGELKDVVDKIKWTKYESIKVFMTYKEYLALWNKK